MTEHDGPRLRMAPSPSGFLHLGNVRTFLFDYLYARGHNGDLILRVEDTDADRSTDEAEQYLSDALRWLGIRWSEGPDVGGPHAPYRQSQRTALHREAANHLLLSGAAYECFCTESDLKQERLEQQARREAPRYSGRCYGISSFQREALIEEGRVPAIRFRVPLSQQLGWDDLVYGYTEFLSDDIGDFVILRANRSPIYNLANVVDDHDMKVTIALRGQSHLSNTPRQMMLYRALGWPVPAFAHVPDVLDLQGRKMGKRFGAKGISEYRDEGYLSAAIVNYVAFLGWSSPSDEEFLSIEELSRQFSFDRVQRSNAAFDPARLEWFNSQYIRRMNIADLCRASAPFVEKYGLTDGYVSPEKATIQLERILPLIRERVRTLAEIPPMIAFFFTQDIQTPTSLFEIGGYSRRQIAAALRHACQALAGAQVWSSDAILDTVTDVAKQIGWKRGDLFMAMRIALTGRTVSPPLPESMEILERPTSVFRMEAAIATLEDA